MIDSLRLAIGILIIDKFGDARFFMMALMSTRKEYLVFQSKRFYEKHFGLNAIM